MRPGTLRYHRSLGFVGDANSIEKVLGINLETNPDSKTGASVGMAPTTLLMGMIGSMLWVSMVPADAKYGMGGKFVGAAVGFFAGTLGAVAFRAGAMKGW